MKLRCGFVGLIIILATGIGVLGGYLSVSLNLNSSETLTLLGLVILSIFTGAGISGGMVYLFLKEIVEDKNTNDSGASGEERD